MTIQESDGMRHVCCDGCSESEEVGGARDSFQEAVEAIKEMGWLIVHIEDEWKHFCVACREDMNDD